MRLILFEDADAARNFHPLACLRPVFELRCGRTLLREKVERAAGRAMDGAFMRPEVARAYAARRGVPVNDPALLDGDDLLLVNGRWLLADESALSLEGPETAARSGGALAYVRILKETAARLDKSAFEAFLAKAARAVPVQEIEARILAWPWELPLANAGAIEDDFRRLGMDGVEGRMSDCAAIWGPEERVFVAESAVVEPFACLDTTGGPVIVEEGARIHPFSRIEGPAVVGRDSLVLGAKIRAGTTVGPVCRVGGEVEESVIHGFSNKYHDGFLGHAYVGEWVNLGALTTNSDLKNDYANVEAYVRGELVDTGSPKVGCCIGDHTKTSIGTLLNTGTMVGAMCNVMGAGSILPKDIPCFVLYMEGKFHRQGLKALFATARTAMSRRGEELTPEDEEMIAAHMEETREERNRAIKKSRQA